MTSDNKTCINKSHDNQVKSSARASFLYGLCVVTAISILSVSACSSKYKGSNALPCNEISLQGNSIVTVDYGNGFNAELPIAKYKDNGYYVVLLKNNSGRADRSNLAFYVTDSNMDSQIHPNQSDISHECFKRRWGSSTPMFMVADRSAPTLYEGKTSLNKIAFGRISGAVAIVAESDSSRPIFEYSAIPTQKTIGAIHHG